MSPGVMLVLVGCGLGALVAASPRTRQATTLRERAVEAQRISAQAAQRARELTDLWIAAQARST